MAEHRVPVVEVYSRKGCHLCDEAIETISALQTDEVSFSLSVIDIEGDDELHREYLERIPVVAVNGVEVAELEVVPHQVRAVIVSAASIAPNVND